MGLLVAALVLGQSGWSGYGADARFPWLPPALNVAYRERTLIGYPDDAYMSRGRLPSRYEYAVATHAIVTNGLQRAEAAVAGPQDDLDRAALLRFAKVLPAFTRAGLEFRKELDSLGVPGDYGQTRLANLLGKLKQTSPERDRLFSDVPVDHWAAKAVGDLRALGLLDGYPDGKYRG